MDEHSVRENIRNLRKSLHLTQQEMADRLGISRVAYSNLETGVTRIMNESLGKVAEVCHVSTEELVLGYAPRKDEPGRLEAAEASYLQQLADYEGRMAEKDREIAALQDHIATLKDSLRTKEDIISLLKSRRLEENA